MMSTVCSVRENFKISGFPTTRQKTEYTCGPASLKAVFHYFGIETTEEVLAASLKTTPAEGTAWSDMVRVSQENGFRIIHDGKLTIAKMKKFLDKKLPVIVGFQACMGRNHDYSNEWDAGHYAVVIGYNKKGFVFEDPYIDMRICLSYKQFVSRWRLDVTQKKINYGLVIQ